MYKILILDIDGIINENKLAKIASHPYVSKFFASAPIIKGPILGIVEVAEALLKTKHESSMGISGLLNALGVTYVGIITDRSVLGLRNTFGNESRILERMDFVQVRESIFNCFIKKPPCVSELWEADEIKPHASVLYNLAFFASRRDIKSREVLIIDDDPEFRRVARESFGFRTSNAAMDIEEDPAFARKVTAPV